MNKLLTVPILTAIDNNVIDNILLTFFWMQIKIHFCKGLIYGKSEREVMITCSCTWCFHSDKRVPAGLEQSLVICYINLSSLYIKSLIFWNNFQKKSFSRLKTAYTYNKNPYWIEHIWLVHSKNPYPLLIWVREKKGLVSKDSVWPN